MSANPPPSPQPAADASRVARLEERMARIEAHLGLTTASATEPASEPRSSLVPAVEIRSEDELEFEVGQNWFALAGIVTLTLGAAFLLSLPLAGLPTGVVSLGGFAIVALLLILARTGRQSYALVAHYLDGAAMALLFFATLRLFLPETRPALAIDSPAAPALLALVVAVNFWLALRRQSAWLAGVALLTGCAAALALGAPFSTLGLLGGVVAFSVVVSRRKNWPGLAMAAVPLCYATYLLWAIGNPIRGGALHWVTAPRGAPLFLLACASILAVEPWLRPKDDDEGPRAAIGALLNAALGYGLFLVHSVVAYPADVVALHAAAFLLFLTLSIAFWRRRQSHAATFFYAMTGYAALSVAIIKASGAPAVFVWLSVQSVIVVATAIWFRSRLIVVANFLIFVAIVLGYVITAEAETGISLGFGIVALVSARILNWQRGRLELKTELMRNAYLLSAFVVFPYALYHLVPGRGVVLAWVALAVIYYALNLVIQNQKYRWMGHATLLLTTGYLVVVGTSHFEPVYRVLSFLVLGTVLLIVSLTFTRRRQRTRSAGASKV